MDNRAAIKAEMIALLPRLRRFARTLTRSDSDADDLVQETCLKALANHAQWDPSQALDRWLFRIARNHWFSELRKQKVRTGQGQIPAEDAEELQVKTKGEDHALAAQVRGQVRALPHDLSSVLLLVSVEGYSYKEAAEFLTIPIGTVMSRIHRARKILSEGLRDKEPVAS